MRFLVSFLPSLRPKVATLLQFLANLRQVPLALGPLDTFQHALQVVQLPLALFQLLGQHNAGSLGFVITFVVLSGVFLGRQQGVQRDGDLPSVRIVEICRPKHFHPPVHLVEVGGEDIPHLPVSLPVLSGCQFLALCPDLPGSPIPGVGQGSNQFLALLTHPLRPLPVPVKGVQKRAEGGEGFLLVEPTVLTDGQEGEVLWAVLFIERSRCELPPTNPVAERQKPV